VHFIAIKLIRLDQKRELFESGLTPQRPSTILAADEALLFPQLRISLEGL